ncbi:MAG TPA: hypothetical protein VGV35_16020 [Bryobacteraceae bacterium]|nr:hypothetical protein [Bryobacteraceae bacterium]
MAIRSHFRCLGIVAGLSAVALLPAQTLSNKSLTGKYLFREVLLVTDSSQNLTVFGTLTFDGNTSGGFTYTGQLLTGNSAPVNANGNGTYSVDAGGVVTMSDPLRSGAAVNARIGNGILAGSNTEAGNNVNSILIAVAAPAAVVTGTLSGTYRVASLEFLSGDFGSRRQTFFSMTADGNGGLGNPTVLGAATNTSDRQTTLTITGATYTVNTDGTGNANFPAPAGADPNQQVLGGTKAIYIAQDGNLFFGGGNSAGGQGLLIGIRAGSNVTNSSFSGLFWSADLRLEGQSYSSYVGSASALGNGNMTASRRLSFNTGVLDVSALVPYTLNPDGSGAALDNDFAVAGNGQLFLGSGLSTGDTSRYELFFGIRTPPVSGTGIFLNPQAVFNVFSFAPAGNPIAPGEFITIYGSGLPAQKAVAVPFPPKLNGVQLLINNTPAPLYLLTATQVFGVVPYSLTGPTATIVLDNNGTRSNTITVPVAVTAPGIAAVAQNGLGAGAITHANGSLISQSSPAARGETIVIYLTGLGQTTPAGVDGAAAVGLNTSSAVQAVYFNGDCGACDHSNVSYEGLTPGFAGLYQINVTIPMGTPTGLAVPLAILTTNGFTDMVDIAIQ